MGKLTALQIRNFKEPGRLGDGQGLFFEITTTGIKRWLYRYKIGGKSGLYVIGRYPDSGHTGRCQDMTIVDQLRQKGYLPLLHGEDLYFSAPEAVQDEAILFAKKNKQRIIQELRAGAQRKVVPFFCQGLECPHFLVEKVPGGNRYTEQVEWQPRACCEQGEELLILQYLRKCLAKAHKGEKEAWKK